MKAIVYIQYIFLVLLISLTMPRLYAQDTAVSADDLDGDGINDRGGQDKCPTTLAKIQGRIAIVKDELSGEQISVLLPEQLNKFVFRDIIPLLNERKEILKEQAIFKRERRRVEQKYGKYAELKKKEQQAKILELSAVVDSFQTKVEEVDERIRNVDPDTYLAFSGNVMDLDGKVLRKNAPVKIRLRVDMFGCLKDDDKDGSPNIVDRCPDYVGTVESGGCPDRDEDGIPDNQDDCPDTKGVVEARGCPDRDGDTIGDKDDDCPDTPGLVELQGCPDRDEDGIPDKTDKCPDIPGPADTQGCPDRDKDTVLDQDDDCPDVPGDPTNKGCPKILEKASRVLFEVNKAIIKPVSFPILDELVDLLKEYPDSYITLAGHTDSEGSDEDNLQLSKDRAKAVEDYLIEKGIAAERITSTGFGETKPIASNATPDGRQRNRRVEMRLSNQKE